MILSMMLEHITVAVLSVVDVLVCYLQDVAIISFWSCLCKEPCSRNSVPCLGGNFRCKRKHVCFGKKGNISCYTSISCIFDQSSDVLPWTDNWLLYLDVACGFLQFLWAYELGLVRICWDTHSCLYWQHLKKIFIQFKFGFNDTIELDYTA